MTLEQIRGEASAALYPRHVLQGCDDALVLFAAAWHGRQDAVWMADAGLTATCVDTDGEKLAEMEFAYPDGWAFVNADAFSYAQSAAASGVSWDVVSIDCPSNLFDECAEALPLWCALARRAVVLGCGTHTLLSEPDGWRYAGRWHRSSFLGGVYWAVFAP